MSFRPATIKDAVLLYDWRDTDERGAWYQGPHTTLESHLLWIVERLDNPLVKILIWEERGERLGMLRVDSNGEIAFHHEVDPLPMLRAATELGIRLKATVDADDPKAALLERAGFSVYPATFLAYKP